MDKKWTKNNEQADKMIKTSPIKVKDSTVPNDINRTKEDRILNAKKILRSRKGQG